MPSTRAMADTKFSKASAKASGSSAAGINFLQLFSIWKSGDVSPTVPMRRRMPSPPPAMGQSRRMASISFCAASHCARGSAARPTAGARAATTARVAAPRSRRPSKGAFGVCGGRSGRSAAAVVTRSTATSARILTGCLRLCGGCRRSSDTPVETRAINPCVYMLRQALEAAAGTAALRART